MPPKKEKRHLVCEFCGVDFFLLECQMVRGRGKFCSKNCANTARQDRASVSCAFCEKVFLRRPSEQNYGETVNQFCSKDCYFEWRDHNRSPCTYPKIGTEHAHRIIAEAILGRPLADAEIVHHIDEDKRNFSPKNLAVFPEQALHARWHFSHDRSGIDIEMYRLTWMVSR